MHRQTTVEAGQPIIVEAVEPLQPITAEEAVEDSTDNSGGSNTNTPSTDNTQPTKQSSTNQPKQADTCDAGCHGFRTTVGQGLCGIVAPLPLKPLCGAIALNAQVQTPHHHHHN